MNQTIVTSVGSCPRQNQCPHGSWVIGSFGQSCQQQRRMGGRSSPVRWQGWAVETRVKTVTIGKPPVV
jgi:hypothetical protein